MLLVLCVTKLGKWGFAELLHCPFYLSDCLSAAALTGGTIRPR